jgi:glycosyltransferase involved in cell wall biosynthesis
LSFEYYKKTFSWKTRLWHKLLRPKKEIYESAKIIAVSKATKLDLIKKYKVGAEKIEVVYEASNLKFQTSNCKLQISSLKKKYKLPEKFILTLSTIEPRKNIEGLLKAFQKLKTETNLPHKLVVAGKKNEKIFAKVKTLNTNKDDIIFTGFIAEEDKACLYVLADVFVYPSFFEGFGLPLVEAMQMGCSVITSSLSSMPEIVREAGQLVNPYDVNSIKQGMQIVLENENLRKQMQKKGLERSLEFSWEKCASETLEIISCRSLC